MSIITDEGRSRTRMRRSKNKLRWRWIEKGIIISMKGCSVQDPPGAKAADSVCLSMLLLLLLYSQSNKTWPPSSRHSSFPSSLLLLRRILKSKFPVVFHSSSSSVQISTSHFKKPLMESSIFAEALLLKMTKTINQRIIQIHLFSRCLLNANIPF